MFVLPFGVIKKNNNNNNNNDCYFLKLCLPIVLMQERTEFFFVT